MRSWLGCCKSTSCVLHLHCPSILISWIQVATPFHKPLGDPMNQIYLINLQLGIHFQVSPAYPDLSNHKYPIHQMQVEQ